MRLAIASDLHAEFSGHRLAIPKPEADAWLLAGDIGVGMEAILWIRKALPAGVPVFYVAGNHEFYRQRPVEVERAYMADLAAECGVTMLENQAAEVDIAGERLRVLGATLWTDFDLFGEDRRRESFARAQAGMSDFQLILGGDGRLRPAETRAWHLESRRFLEKALTQPFAGRTVVLTHHAPVREAARYQGMWTGLSPAFGSDLRPLVETGGADLWAFGHTHQDWDETIGRTRLVSRQGGYPGEREEAGAAPFEPLVVEL